MVSVKSQSTPKVALFTGSFDPITNGHLDIITRASALFDKLYVGLFENVGKQTRFDRSLRQTMIEEAIKGLDNVEIIEPKQDLTVNVAQSLGANYLIRSIRTAEDLEYEKNMIYFNRELTGIETVLFPAKPELEYLSSSRIRELLNYGADISKYVPASVVELIKNENGKQNVR